MQCLYLVALALAILPSLGAQAGKNQTDFDLDKGNDQYRYHVEWKDVYRKPLAVLARNKGDCDSKSVLYMALLRAHDPDLPLAAVYIKNHMLVGVGLDREVGDQAFRRHGQRYLYAEPAGPAQLPVGDSPAKHRTKVGAGKVRAVP